MFFFLKSSKFGVFHTYRTSQFRQATFQVHSSHMWLTCGYCIGQCSSRVEISKLSLKGQVGNILVFVGQVVSFITIYFCSWDMKVAIDNE